MELDAKYAAARGFVDAVIAPEETRDALELSLRTSLNYPGPHVGQLFSPEPGLRHFYYILLAFPLIG